MVQPWSWHDLPASSDGEDGGYAGVRRKNLLYLFQHLTFTQPTFFAPIYPLPAHLSYNSPARMGEDAMDWLEWTRRLNRNRLERIVALLLALAVLAERAAGLTGPRRRSALGILGYAEAEARAFVIAMAQESGTPAEPAAEMAPAHGQAERLAAGFRALALILGAMLSLARRFARSLPKEAGLRVGPPEHKSAELKQFRRVAALPVLDTS